MHDTSVVLSISLLASGKEDMPKSLESLQYFKNAIPCEIILVDTGCNAEMRALVERYGDKIVDFTWCNDFAAARNAGLKEARGEWFMFLDDDEWFDNPREIIEFFRSGEYKQYNGASYVVRNYTNEAGTMYEDSYPSRMVKLRPDTRFVGKIHERLEPFPMPRKAFSDFVHHYGYVYKDEKQKREHARRNIGPLLEMRKECPGDPRWFCQLAQEYFAIEEYQKTIEVCEEGLREWNELADEDKGQYAPAFVGATYAYLLISFECLASYEEEEKRLGKAFGDPLMKLRFMEPSVAFYCLVAARLYSRIGRYELCRDYFQRYLDFYKKLKDERALIEVGTAAVVGGVFQENMLYGLVLMSVGAILRTGDYELAQEAFYLLDWNDRRLLHQEKWERDMVDACCARPFHPVFSQIMQTLVSREEGMKEMYIIFLDAEVKYTQENEIEKKSRLLRLVAELEYEHRYILCAKILWAAKDPSIISEEVRNEKVTELFEKLFKRYPKEIFEIRADVFDAAEQLKISLEPMLFQIDYRVWKKELEQWSREASLDKLQKWDYRVAGWKSSLNIRYDIFTLKCIEGYLIHFSEATLTMEQMEALLWGYIDKTLSFYKTIYMETVFSNSPDILPDEVQLVSRLEAVRRQKECGNDWEALEQLRKCLGIYPELDAFLAEYAREYRDQVMHRNQEAEKAKKELLELADTLKKTAKLQIERKEYQAAKMILSQIHQCLPEEQEVLELLDQISNL